MSPPRIRILVFRVEVEGLPIGDRIKFGAGQGEGTPGVFKEHFRG
jgi:hypothetical protein